jgi:predicted HTH domain antitoxin
MTLEIPDSLLLALGGARGDAETEVRLAAAVMLYARGRLTAGKAAELAGIPKLAFMAKLGEYGVSAFDMTRGELQQDTQAALRTAGR